MNMIDDFSRKTLLIEMDTFRYVEYVAQDLEQLFSCKAMSIRMETNPELTSQRLEK